MLDRIAVFGGGGFIGSHLTRRLLGRGFDLEVVDIDGEKIEDVRNHGGITFHQMDIYESGNDERCTEIVNRSDLVIDLIAYANPQQYVDMPLEVVDLNLFQNLKIVEDCIEADTRLIQFSTCEVYGMLGNRTDGDVVFDEDTSNLIMGPIGNQRWIYATAKQLLERMVYAHGQHDDLDWTIVRPFNFIGPEMDYIIESPDEGTPRVFASFMSSLLYDHPMYLVNGGQNKRTFTYIDDAIDALEHIIENEGGAFSEEVVNIGTPDNEATIREFAELMRDIYRERSPSETLPEVIEVSGEEYYGEGYEDCDRRVPDIDKLRAVGWEPEYDLRETLEYAMTYYIKREELGQSPNLLLSD